MTEDSLNRCITSGIRNLLTIFAVALRLGLTSFGGPIAHIGFFPPRIRSKPSAGYLNAASRIL